MRYTKIDDTKINQAVSLKSPLEFSGLIHYQNLAGKITKITIYDQGINLSNPSFLKKENEKNSFQKSKEKYDYYKDWSLPWERIEDNLPRYREQYDVLKQTVYFNYFSTSNYQGEQWDYLYTSTKPFIKLVVTMKPYSDTRSTTFTEETLYKNIAVGADRAYRSFLPFPSESPFLANAPAPLKRIISNKIGQKLKRNLGLSVQQKRWVNSTLRNPDDTQFKHLTALYSVLKDIDFFKGGENAHKEKMKKIAKKIINGIKKKQVYSSGEYVRKRKLDTLYITKRMKNNPKKLNRVLGIYDIFREDMVLPSSVSDYSVYSGIKEQAIIEGFIKAIFEESVARIFNELTGKAECLNNHLDKKGNSFIKNILKKFQGNSKFNIKIVSKNKVFPSGVTTGNGLNGKTRYTKGSSLINIEISTSKLSNMPALAAARTLIHEYIHADMYRKIYTTNYDGDLDFKTTYEKYKQGNFKASLQHETMAELYVDSMKDALKYFHKNVLVGDYNYLTDNGTNPLPDNFYEALAWQGLKDHSVKAYTDLTNSKKTELTNALNTHYHSTTKNCPN